MSGGMENAKWERIEIGDCIECSPIPNVHYIMNNDCSEYAKDLVEKHWGYIRDLLEIHMVTPEEIGTIGFHYKTSGIHFFGHGYEYAKKGN